MVKKNIAIAGLGLHAQHHHYVDLERRLEATTQRVTVPLVIDLASQQPRIGRYLRGRTLQPEEIFYLDDIDRNAPVLPRAVDQKLTALLQSGRLDGIIVATEPQSHLPYLIWAARNGVDVFVDKPVFTPAGHLSHRDRADALEADFRSLERLRQTSGSRITVACARRQHAGYLLVQERLEEAMGTIGMGITTLAAYHTTGVWNMPNEYHERENHPYRYGYGELMHGGYHTIDLMTHFMSLAQRVRGKGADEMVISTMHTNPADLLTQFTPEDYIRNFPETDAETFTRSATKELSGMGEVDVQALFQFRQRGRVLTTGHISSLQTTISERGWAQLPEDTYKRNGRLRHERLICHVGPFFCVETEGHRAPRNSGQADIFRIRIWRNTKFLPGSPFEEVVMSDSFQLTDGQRQTLAGAAQAELLDMWLDDMTTSSELPSHRLTIAAIAACYRSMDSSLSGLQTVRLADVNQLTSPAVERPFSRGTATAGGSNSGIHSGSAP